MHFYIKVARVRLTKDDKRHTIEPGADVRQDP